MLSLQRILGQDKKFFDLLEASAKQGRASVEALRGILKSSSDEILLDAFVESRRKDKQVTKELNDMLCKTFVTALEREDIESLANALYKIPKTIEKFAERYTIAADKIKQVDFTKNVELMQKATELVQHMIRHLQGHELQELVRLNSQMQKIENDGDDLLNDANELLFSGKYTPLQVIILKDLFELLEKVLDRCRSAGNIMSQIALKHT